MALFVGGPFDGQDLPVDPKLLSNVRLPSEDQLDEFLTNPGASAHRVWPNLYVADLDVDPPVYRFVPPADKFNQL